MTNVWVLEAIIAVLMIALLLTIGWRLAGLALMELRSMSGILAPRRIAGSRPSFGAAFCVGPTELAGGFSSRRGFNLA
jgi:hypothetical protein